MHTFWKNKKKEAAQQPPFLDGKSDTTNSWIVTLLVGEKLFRVI